jgi:hypothetical protein
VYSFSKAITNANEKCPFPKNIYNFYKETIQITIKLNQLKYICAQLQKKIRSIFQNHKFLLQQTVIEISESIVKKTQDIQNYLRVASLLVFPLLPEK